MIPLSNFVKKRPETAKNYALKKISVSKLLIFTCEETKDKHPVHIGQNGILSFPMRYTTESDKNRDDCLLTRPDISWRGLSGDITLSKYLKM